MALRPWLRGIAEQLHGVEMDGPSTCAACGGSITPPVNSVFWEGHEVHLCTACVVLGDANIAPKLSPEDIKTLADHRADPSAPHEDIETRVREWIRTRSQTQEG